MEKSGLAEAKVNYRLHDWCISRQRYWGPPIPIIYCDQCGPVPVPEEDLPVILPRLEDFKPDDSGISPLARVEEWYETTCPECGGKARRETDVSDTFLDSSWYFLRYPSTDRDDVPMDPEITRRWLPVDCYIGGEEHAVLAPPLRPVHHHGPEGHGAPGFRGALHQVPEARPHHS